MKRALTIAALSLIGAVGAAAAMPGPGRAAAATSDGSVVLVMHAHGYTYGHYRRRVYARRHSYPGYGPGYVYVPYPDWTTRCMEDLGYGRRGMYGCGR